MPENFLDSQAEFRNVICVTLAIKNDLLFKLTSAVVNSNNNKLDTILDRLPPQQQ